MRIVFSILLLALAFNGTSQTQAAFVSAPKNEGGTGIIQGRLITTDHQPAAHVNISVKGQNIFTTSDEQGFFLLQNLKEGNYTLQISMTGIKTFEKTVTVFSDKTTGVEVVLQEDAKELSNVMITAYRSMNEKVTTIGKLPAQPKDIPQAITVIDKTILEKQQVQSMSDVLQNVNGVYVMGTTGGYQEEIAARGYSFGSNNTFKNGARFNNGIRPEFSSVEKVEVLKGGNAILYGNVGAGGVLNIITKKPKSEHGGEISFRAGSYDFYKPSIDVYGPFNAQGRVAYRVNASYENAGSFRDGVSSERIYFNPSLLFKAGRNTEILLEGDFMKDERNPDYGTGAINYTIANVPRSTYLNVPWAYINTNQSTATSTISHRLNNNLSIKHVFSYQNFHNELFGAARPNASGNPIATDGTWVRSLQKTRTEEDYYFTSLDLTASFNTGSLKHNLLFGADADKYKTRATAFKTYQNAAINNKNIYDTVNIFDPASLTARGDIPYVSENRITTSPIFRYGVYVQDLISILPNLKFLAGIRYSYQHNQEGTVDTIAKNTRGYISEIKNDAFSPRVGIVYQPTKSTSVFASYTNSFSVNAGAATRDIYDQPLAPSIIDQFEVGIKNDLFKGALSVNVTAYRIVNSNYAQTALFLADGSANTDNNIKELSGETTSKGIEVDIMSKPVKGFHIIAGYSYNDMRFTGVNGNNLSGNVLGERLRYNPAHTANTSIFYSFLKESKLKGFYLGAGAFYTGDRLAGRNTNLNPNSSNKIMALPDYVTADVNAGYANSNFAVRLKISNLFDQLSYNAHDDNSINPIAPRQFTGTISYKF